MHMMINLTTLKELIDVLVEEYKENIKLGKKPSQIRIRLDCVLKGLMNSIGAAVPRKPTDKIVEIDI